MARIDTDTVRYPWRVSIREIVRSFDIVLTFFKWSEIRADTFGCPILPRINAILIEYAKPAKTVDHRRINIKRSPAYSICAQLRKVLDCTHLLKLRTRSRPLSLSLKGANRVKSGACVQRFFSWRPQGFWHSLIAVGWTARQNQDGFARPFDVIGRWRGERQWAASQP